MSRAGERVAWPVIRSWFLIKALGRYNASCLSTVDGEKHVDEEEQQLLWSTSEKDSASSSVEQNTQQKILRFAFLVLG